MLLQTPYNLYPELDIYHKDWLKVTNSHEIYFEECGNPDGKPVVFLHGGPGSGCNPSQRRFFDPEHYRIILLDQRGCGRSRPLGCTKHNTTPDLVADIEALRLHLNIDKWLVFGGSWGSTLALAYTTQYSSLVHGLILRGIFLSRQSELDWFLGEVKHFYPENWQQLVSYLPGHLQDNVFNTYYNLVFSDDVNISVTASRRWNAFEGSILRLMHTPPSEETISKETKDSVGPSPTVDENLIEQARARVQMHYIKHGCFVDGDALLKQAANLTHIPTVIVQGRYDMVCPPQTAWELSLMMPQAELHMVADAGHSAMEPGITSALVAATEKFKQLV
ncbi:MAG: prolyl aminopeptidase [Methylophilaceae bacterium]|nr:prolyl aminopeptidase [Methylophilaceae bacterium]